MASLPFLDAAASPVLTRAFYIPGISPARNRYKQFVLMAHSRRLQSSAADGAGQA